MLVLEVLCMSLGLALQTVDHPLDSTAKNVVPPKLVVQSDPEMPKLKRKERCGQVKVTFVVDEHGMPVRLEVAHSGGPKCNHAVLDAVGHYRFEPATQNGRPVCFKEYVEVDFPMF